jgi:hypothetical protein
MALLRVVEPTQTRIDLGDGEWVDVRDELTYGETRTMQGQMRPYAVVGADSQVIAKEVAISIVAAYVLDWSATDGSGKRIALHTAHPEKNIAAFDAISAPAFQAIYAAVITHIAAQEAKRSAEKNGPSPSTVSAVT